MFRMYLLLSFRYLFIQESLESFRVIGHRNNRGLEDNKDRLHLVPFSSYFLDRTVKGRVSISI
ncbi:MAG: hypothetical protein ACRD42_03635, partial [Nitrososphaeraceae archaeon]